MVSFARTLKDIRDLRIQGAHAIAEAGLLALKQKAQSSKAISKGRFLREMEEAKNLLFNVRATEPALRNAIHYVLGLSKGVDVEEIKDNFCALIKSALDHLTQTEHLIAEIGAKKIRNNSIIFTHCHSSAVMAILHKAKQQKKFFEVHNTETRPLYQGRKTARECAKLAIPVKIYVDSGARYALKKVDLMLIGADAITSEGKIINKIGSEMFAEIANKYDIPVYVCTDSWKFDASTIFGYEEEIETRRASEVWRRLPKGITVDNHAFEKIDTDCITGIISELGIYKPEIFVEEIRRNYSWMFR